MRPDAGDSIHQTKVLAPTPHQPSCTLSRNRCFSAHNGDRSTSRWRTHHWEQEGHRCCPPDLGLMSTIVQRVVFAKTLVRASEVKVFEIARATPAGWEASRRAGEGDIERRQYSDWHHVERVMADFAREVADLRQGGWVDAE